MQLLSRLCCGLALSALTFGASEAAATVLSSSVLASSPGSYAGLDASGTNLNVSFSPGGSLGVFGPGEFQGLYFGGNQGSATYTLQFSAAIDYFSIRINALSTFDAFVETLSDFTIDGGAVPTFAFQNIQNTSWDGFTVTSGPQDNGEFILEITPQGGGTFTSVSFDHLQINNPNGSIIREVRYELASGPNGGVPEPHTWALLILGFGATGAALRRRALRHANVGPALAC